MKEHYLAPVRITTLLCCGALSSTAFASGFRIPEVSIAGLSMGSALVADTQTAGAMHYNPAAMAFHEQHTLVAGVMNIHPSSSVTPTLGTPAESQGESNILVPNIFYAQQFNEQMSWGIALNVPFGLETQWPDETFTAYAGALDPLEPEQTKLEMFNLNPNMAYKISANTSIAVGVDYYVVRKLTFNTQSIAIEGDGKDLGWNIGLQHVMNDWSFGLAYRSSVKVDLDGTVDATGVGSTKSDATAEVEFPSLLQLGARYQINPAMALEFDVERTGWSSFDIVEIKHSSLGIPNPVNGEHSWSNTTTYRLAGSYQATPSTQLRFGYALDETPQGEEHFSPRVPDSDRQTFSIGFAHTMRQAEGKLSVEAGYMYVLLDDRTVNATTPETVPVNGKYKTDAHLVGIGITSQF